MNKLSILRRQRRMRQKELARDINVVQSVVSDMEQLLTPPERVRPDVRERLETIFGRTLEELLEPIAV